MAVSPVPAHATPPSPIISIRELGYGPSYSLAGAAARADFAFPLPTYGMAGGELTLVTNPSPALRANSLVRVFADGASVATTSVAALRQNGTWTVRLPPAPRRYLQIRIESALFVESANACNDEAAALWIAIDGRSALRYTPAPGLESIADFFRFPGGRFILDADWRTPATQSSAIAVYAAARRALGNDPVEFVIGPARESPAITRPERHIVLATDGQPLHRDGDTLYVSADAAGLQSLTREASRAARLAGSVTAAMADLEQQAPKTCGPNRICLQDLGLGDQNVSGTGSLMTSFGFTLAQFRGWPDNLAFDLDAAFDAVPTTTLERAMLRVRLNGALVHTEDIRGRSSVHRAIPLPAPLVDVGNRLEIEFFYAPVTGNCQGSPYAMTAQLRRTSALTWGGLGATRGRLGEVITSTDGRVALELVNTTPVLAQTAARVLGAIGVSTVFPLDATHDRRGSHMLHVVVGRNLAGVPVHLTLARDVELIAAATGHQLLKASPDRPLVSLEYLPDRSTLVLQASTSADDETVRTAFSDLLSDGQWLGAAGNTLVSNGDETLVLDLTSGSLVVHSAGGPAWYWTWLRWLIFLAATGAVAYLLYLLYVRLGRRPPIPVRPHALSPVPEDRRP
jgi:hypothetical protein